MRFQGLITVSPSSCLPCSELPSVPFAGALLHYHRREQLGLSLTEWEVCPPPSCTSANAMTGTFSGERFPPEPQNEPTGSRTELSLHWGAKPSWTHSLKPSLDQPNPAACEHMRKKWFLKGKKKERKEMVLYTGVGRGLHSTATANGYTRWDTTERQRSKSGSRSRSQTGRAEGTLTSPRSSQHPTPAATGQWACGVSAAAPGQSSPSPASSADTLTAPGPSWTASCQPRHPGRPGGPAHPQTGSQGPVPQAGPHQPLPHAHCSEVGPCSRSQGEVTGWRLEPGLLTWHLHRETIPDVSLK